MRPRTLGAALALLGVGGLVLGFRDELALSLATGALGRPFLRLLLAALGLLLGFAGLYLARAPLAAGAGRLVAGIDALEERLARLPRGRGQLVRVVLLGVAVAAPVVAVVTQTRLANGLETRLYDQLYRLRFPERSQAELVTGREESPAERQASAVVLALDDETLAHLGWPLPRHHYARLIDAVAAARPASLTFDVSLVDPAPDHPEWDEAIGRAAGRAGNVFFSFTLARGAGERAAPAPGAWQALERNLLPFGDSALALPPYPELVGGEAAPLPVIEPIAARARGVAMANVLLDADDDVLRHSLVVARLDRQLLPSLSLRLAANALGVPLSEVRVVPGSHVALGSERRVPIDELGRTLVRYHGRHDARGAGPFQYVSLWTLLRSEATVTLAGNPLGDDQRFRVDERTRLTGDAVQLGSGKRVSGVADYSADPGRILELRVVEDGGGEPEFELLDESHLRFSTTLGTHQAATADLGLLAGKHVLVGSTALAAADMRNGPLGALPGVEHHATMLANILHDDFFRQVGGVTGALVALGAALLAAAIGVAASPGLGLGLLGLLWLALFTLGYLLFVAGVHLPLVGPLAAASGAHLWAMALGARATRRAQARAEGEREFVRRTFGRYLTEQVVEQLLGSPEGLRLGGRRSFVTILMTDLRGFTSMCGAMEPEAVVRLLNHYLEAMTRIINRYGGTIDEFIGDAILVVFGAPVPLPQAELRAAACAIEMLNEMPAVNRWNLANGLPEVQMGIGIHSGEVVAGNIGSELRAKYGIVGSTINLASRVESYTVGGQVLLSEATREGCGDALTVGLSQVVSPKGVKGTLTIHEALAVGAPFGVELRCAEETLVAPAMPLVLRYATIQEKQVGEFEHEAQVEALSALGMELRVPEELPPLTNLMLRVVEGGGLRPGDLAGKVLRSNVRPGVVYLRLTSVPAEARPVLAAARGEGPRLESPLA